MAFIIFRRFFAASFCIALLGCATVYAGDFTVSPIRLELGSSVRSGAFTVRNEGTEILTFQLQAMAWTQDADGKDQYADTQELVFFPKILSVEPGKEGLVRVGAKNTVLPSEKTYRLFIEELPGIEKTPNDTGARVNVMVRFGAPIFVAAFRPQDGLVIGNLGLAKGILSFSATNTGNRHQFVQGIDLKGMDGKGNPVYALTLSDRYLLAGTSKSFTTTLTADQCAKITTLAIDMKTDKAAVSRKIDVTPVMCP
jgi:fimbrial chaperone protein